jgi:hypothetical protein
VVVVNPVLEADLTGRHLHRGAGRGEVVEDEDTVGILVADVAALVDKLKNEAKVI